MTDELYGARDHNHSGADWAGVIAAAVRRAWYAIACLMVERAMRRAGLAPAPHDERPQN